MEVERFTLSLGVDVTFPMGKADYTNEELSQLIIDPISNDLMIANVYGEGLNIIPHATAIFQATSKLTMGLGVRYEVTGEYDPTSDTANDNFNPGDRLLALVNTAYEIDAGRFLIFTATYFRLGTDVQGGKEIYRSGDAMTAELRYIHSWWAAFSSVLSVKIRTQQPNEAVDQTATLISEQNNSNNDYLELFLNNIYRYSSDFSFLALAGYKQALENEYATDSLLYDAGRSKYFIEPGMMWFLNRNLYFTAKFRYSIVADKQDAFSPIDTNYTIWNADAGIVYAF
jgi:hypothetical protein